MRPHPDDFNDAFFFVDLVEVSREFFIMGRVLKGVFLKDFERFFSLWLEPRGKEF
jgi:hypothetical protein